MRLLMFHVGNFRYRPFDETTNTAGEEVDLGECLLVWMQAEKKDEEERIAVLRKTVKNIRWLANKHGIRRVVLHSFAHLGESKSTPEFAESVIGETARRLMDREYDVHVVYWGLNEFSMHVLGPSLSKVYKAF